MDVALQWHTLHNTAQPIILAPELSLANSAGERPVLFVLCDSAAGEAGAPVLASRIFDVFHERQPKAEAPAAGDESPDTASQLTAAMAESLIWAGARGCTGLAAIAAAVHQDKLVVARHRGGRVYLLRDGALRNLTDESFDIGPSAGAPEPQIGLLDLVSHDRLFLCTEDVHRALSEEQINLALLTISSSRRTAQELLNLAARASPTGTLGVVVADYMDGRLHGQPKPVFVMRSSVPERFARPRRLLPAGAIAGLAALLGAAVVGFLALSGAFDRPVSATGQAASVTAPISQGR